MGLRIQLKAPLELDHDLHRRHLTTWQLLWHYRLYDRLIRYHMIDHISHKSHTYQHPSPNPPSWTFWISFSFQKAFGFQCQLPEKSSVPSLASVKRSSVYEKLFYQAASFLHSLQNGRSVKLDHNLFRNQSFMSAKIHRDVNRRLRQRKSCLQRFTVICLQSRLARLFLVITQSLGFKNMQIGLTFIDGWLMFKDRVNANHFAMEVSL